MIWGIQWDETLKWLIDTGEKTYAEIASDSTSWGNYWNNRFTYYTNTSKSTETKPLRSSTKIPAGAYEGTNTNNIYDLAGNVYDWTMESNGLDNDKFRYNCGGCYGDHGDMYPAMYRYYYDPYDKYEYVGLRCSLFIK